MTLKIVVEKLPNASVLRLDGRIDAASAPLLEKKLAELFKADEKWLCLDFTRVNYLSSAGMRLLLAAAKKLKSLGGKLALASLSEDVMEIIRMAGFERILNIYPNEKEALGALD